MHADSFVVAVVESAVESHEHGLGALVCIDIGETVGIERIVEPAFALVLECVPSQLGRRVTEELEISTIGIGAGPDTDGQVLVLQDLLGLTPGPSARFVKRYADLASQMNDALRMFAKEVAEGIYPAPEHEYQ